MGQVWIREFTGGLDTRRLPETSKGGTLIRAEDGHINRGGEFEQRAAFVPTYALPPGTTGLAFTSAGLVVFGSGPQPGGIPTGVAYQRLQHPDGTTALSKILSYDLFSGKLFVSAQFVDGQVHQFYDGNRVTDYGSNTEIRPGTFVRTFGRKVYYLLGPYVIYSALQDATNFNTDATTPTSPGAGFNDLSEEDYGSEDLSAIGRYQNYLAFFSDRTIQIRYVDPDPAQSKQIQTLHNTGTVSPRSVTQFGDSDLFYLDSSGLRSLRARDASNSAASSDIGSAIDTLLTAAVRAALPATVANVIGLIEPRDGRFWLSLGSQIYVFSYFPAAKVSAWTIYNPGFNVDDMTVFDRRSYVRSEDQIYVYGGLGEVPVYDDTPAVAWLPYLDAEKPTEQKGLQGIDAAVRGEWEVSIGMDPTNLDASDKVATITQTTFPENRIPATHRATHFSLRFSSIGVADDGGPATLGSAVMTFTAPSDKAQS